ncbi:LRR receptor-like serine/threonine-protein kinase EFR [Salvia splendens]|uniref:LRR receptor-like serine/threonine-protein kinase EFR n=1 Tax=Salvia splendens TaxID=180675 RepID=UPI001C280D17|nr:LRR receptor-like serine/threonine-protein kinase EFR [Salvia splendens]
MVLVIIVVFLIIRRKHVKLAVPVDTWVGVAWRVTSNNELLRGTDSFSETNLLGRESFGSVFKGAFSDGMNFAVKVFNVELEGANKSFETESRILSTIRHRNLVRLLNISIDVALALEYLHHGNTFPIVHCDIKPSNVLLDEDMTARVADFGIAKLFVEEEAMVQTKTLATVGYAAPEYGSEGKVSTSADVYSFGILLLEMFTRKKPTDDMFNEEMSLKEGVSGALEANGINQA